MAPNTTIQSFPSIENIQIKPKAQKNVAVSLDRQAFFKGQNPFDQKESI